MVARRRVLLVAGLVLLVDDDEAERAVRDRREDRAARADDDIGAALGEERPLLVALRLGEADFILIGKIFQLESRQGKNVERTYYVSLKLAFAAGENRNLEAWTKRASFTTQGRKSDLAL